MQVLSIDLDVINHQEHLVDYELNNENGFYGNDITFCCKRKGEMKLIIKYTDKTNKKRQSTRYLRKIG